MTDQLVIDHFFVKPHEKCQYQQCYLVPDISSAEEQQKINNGTADEGSESSTNIEVI